MTSPSGDHFTDRGLLSQNQQFEILPERVQDWVMDSPLASAQFARFLRDGGQIEPDPGEALAAYYEQKPGSGLPTISINPTYYPLVNHEGKNTIEMEKALFAMLAHEVGHHTINSRTHPFTGTTREANVQYRAEHEAMTVLNAFRIFDELKQRDPAYQPAFGSVGYGDSLNVWAVYNEWQKHHDDRVVIRSLAHMVGETEDKRTKLGQDAIPDYNHDGKVTHAERYMRDWDESEKRRQNSPAGPGRGRKTDEEDGQQQERDPIRQGEPRTYRFYPRTAAGDFLAAYGDAAQRGDDAACRAAAQQYEQRPEVQAWLQVGRDSNQAEDRQRALEEQQRQEQQRQEQERHLAQQQAREHSHAHVRTM